MCNRPRLADNDHGEILITLNGRELRGWTYNSSDEQLQKMKMAREYIEGWLDRDHLGEDHS